MDANEPCVVEGVGIDWGLRRFVDAAGAPDVAALARAFGDADVPVVDASTKKATTMPLRRFAEIWTESMIDGTPRYYLKDWHFRLDGLGALAPVPDVFADDWLSGSRDMDYHFLSPPRRRYFLGGLRRRIVLRRTSRRRRGAGTRVRSSAGDADPGHGRGDAAVTT